MPGNYSRVKTWISGEILTASDQNAEFNNEINNAIPASIDDYSTNVTQMQSVSDPGEVGSESLPTSLSGELERIRFTIAELKKLFKSTIVRWYESITGDIDKSLTMSGAINYIEASGTDTYVATLSPVVTAYVPGAEYKISFTNANTATAPTINVNSLGAKIIKRSNGSALVAG